MLESIKAALVSSEHGYDDFDIEVSQSTSCLCEAWNQARRNIQCLLRRRRETWSEVAGQSVEVAEALRKQQQLLSRAGR